TDNMETATSYHHGNLRAALIDAGLKILDSEGVTGLGLRAAARRVGVSHAAPLRHFADLAHYAAAVAAACFEPLADGLETALAAAEDPLSGLRATGHAYVSYARRYPNRFRMLAHPVLGDKARFPRLDEVSDRAFGVLRRAISAAQEFGAIRAGEVEPLAMGAWSTVHGLAAIMSEGLMVKM